MSAVLIGAGVGVVGTGLKLYEGLHQDSQANAIQKNLKDPTYKIPPEFAQNTELARQMAQQGLPQQQVNNAQNGINQNNAAAIAAISRSANPGSGITSVTRQADNATNNLSAEDAQARQNNQRYFIGQNAALGNQELAKQQSDVFDKYTRDFNQMQAYRGAGQQNIAGAAQDAIGLGMTGLNYAKNNPSTNNSGRDANAAFARDNSGQAALNSSNASFNGYLGANPAPQQQVGLPSLGYDQSGGINPSGLRPGTIMPQKPQYYGQGWGWPQ